MYNLILTHDERKAFDWVGDRYSTGDGVIKILSVCDWVFDADEMGLDVDWDSNIDIEFKIPERLAWEIKEKYEFEGGLWTCFGGVLAGKMQDFVDSIV